MTDPTDTGAAPRLQRLPDRLKDEPAEPMGTPRQLLAFYTAEVYRYRLAMHDQHERARDAKEALRAAPESSNAGERWRALTETQFFFTAVRGILQMADAIADVGRTLSPPLRSRVIDAKRRFNDRAPHAKEMRDILIHLDAYMAGEGFKKLPYPEHRVKIATPDDDLGLYVGGVALSAAKTATAAEQLAVDLIDAVKQLEAEEKGKGLT